MCMKKPPFFKTYLPAEDNRKYICDTLKHQKNAPIEVIKDFSKKCLAKQEKKPYYAIGIFFVNPFIGYRTYPCPLHVFVAVRSKRGFRGAFSPYCG